MKPIKYICFLFLVTGVCKAQTYQLSGDVKGLKNDSLLILSQKGKTTSIKKIKVVAGKFAFGDTLKEPYFVQVFKLKNGANETEGKLTEFLAEAGTITITGPSPRFEDVQVAGSVADQVLKKYLKEDAKIVANWEQLKVQYDQYVAQKDTLSRKKVANELNDMLFKERIPLLKQYVAQYKNNMLGALLPNFCLLKDLLSKADYLEMYNMLTVQFKQTDYAKSTFEKSK
ncbi:DUF4369 domain-containing protein [Pedobacter sp. Hv1]|uniref:DUF4369 domain-containing protein n=1 Tax=Pedobacter sp. Hv1 TaxID=1740090 RepID=UPI0006D8A210|nr:DUF4369 domain-containing protein [Pedobacter sp. Hv1]KQB99165.1 hypothetical protein AQF98_16410 [Pedobacter sp. Hv1]